MVRTPVLDSLAAGGVVFSNCYTPSPICVPARQCLMSGQLPHTNGCEGWVDLPEGHMTFARQFRRYAYRTVCCGKLHHSGPDQMQGWGERPAGDVKVNASAEDAVLPEEAAKYAHPFADSPRPGHENFSKWTESKEVKRAGVGNSHVLRDDEDWTGAALRVTDQRYNY